MTLIWSAILIFFIQRKKLNLKWWAFIALCLGVVLTGLAMIWIDITILAMLIWF